MGIIYDKEGRPVSGVEVFVGEVHRGTSDSSGRFFLPNLEFGQHLISARRIGFRSWTDTLDFRSRDQVLYVSLQSGPQLLEEIKELLQSRDYVGAKRLFDIWETVSPEDPSGRFLFALYYYRIKEWDQALSRLQILWEEGYRYPSVLLLMADVYEWGLTDTVKVAEYLQRYLGLVSDYTQEERLRRLQGER